MQHTFASSNQRLLHVIKTASTRIHLKVVRRESQPLHLHQYELFHFNRQGRNATADALKTIAGPQPRDDENNNGSESASMQL